MARALGLQGWACHEAGLSGMPAQLGEACGAGWVFIPGCCALAVAAGGEQCCCPGAAPLFWRRVREAIIYIAPLLLRWRLVASNVGACVWGGGRVALHPVQSAKCAPPPLKVLFSPWPQDEHAFWQNHFET